MSQYQAFYDWNECTLDEEHNELNYKHIDEQTYLTENNYNADYTGHYNISLPAFAYKPGDVIKCFNARTNERTIPCPFCKGTGTIIGYNKEELTCPRCTGKGTELGYVTYTYNTKTGLGFANDQWQAGKITKINFHCLIDTGNYYDQMYQTYSTSTLPSRRYFCDYIIETGKTELIDNDSNKEKFTFTYNSLPLTIPHKHMNKLSSRLWYDTYTHEYKLYEYIYPNTYTEGDFNYYDGYMTQLNKKSTKYENEINDINYRDYTRNNSESYQDDNHTMCAFCLETLEENEGG